MKNLRNKLKNTQLLIAIPVVIAIGIVAYAQSLSSVAIEAELGVTTAGISKQSETTAAATASKGSYIVFNEPVAQAPDTFFEDFTGDTTINTLNYGVWHRDPYLVAMTQWNGDHSDLGNGNCGAPTTTRLIHRDLPSESIYLCQTIGDDPGKAHIMTSVGDTSGISIAWLSPKQVFNHVDSFKFKVNLTDLGERKWWKAGVVSDALYNSTYNGSCCGPVPGFLHQDGSLVGPDRLIMSYSAAKPHGLLQIGDDFGPNLGVIINPAPTDKATRYPVSVTDNKNGKVTFNVAGSSLTVNGSFPACPCRVVLYDESYTPNKALDQKVTDPYTWHWDDIQVN